MQTLSKKAAEPARDILGSSRQPLDVFFHPKTIALVGATEKAGSVGRTLLWNLIGHPFGGTVFPVNPKRASVLGIKAYPNLGEVPEPVDLAVIATPASTIPAIVDECVAAKIKGAIVVSAGFKEIGAEGIALEQEVLTRARAGNLRIIGPNCLGVMNPVVGLNATFAGSIASPGNVGFISQSGALCTSILDWSFKENVGFSAFVSIGSMLDVDWGDLIYYLGDDPNTSSIAIYMESIGNARSFLSAAREVALSKPIIVIKAGRTEAAAAAAASHTGTLAGSDSVLDAAFRRCGVLRVQSIEDLFDMAHVLAKQPRPKGKRLTILTNAGGPGVLTTDALIADGGELAPLSPETISALDAVLPPSWSHSNPIDILGDAEPDRYAKAIEIALNDPNSDGLLTILTPQAMTDPKQTAQYFAQTVKACQQVKPIMASWMGGTLVAPGEHILNQAKIFTAPFPDTAARIFNNMWRYAYNLRGLYETPSLMEDEDELPRSDRARAAIASVQAEGRTLLTEAESKELLKIYGIPALAIHVATTAEAAMAAATELGFPVVVKLHSHTITHKSDVGGVKLSLQDEAAVERAFYEIRDSVSEQVGESHFLGVTVQPMVSLKGYEIILGSSLDPQFGPVLLFGAGGTLVEVFRDRALALPPLNTTLARRMMEQTRIYEALQGVRGRQSVDLPQLEQLLVHFSQLIVEQPRIKEIDINPLLVSETGMVALDARVVLHDLEVPDRELPKSAIRPYPVRYIDHWTLQDGREVTIRPIRPEDERLVVKYHETLSEESVYLRYFHLMKLSTRVAHDRLARLCFIDYDREIALVADSGADNGHGHQILGIARLSKQHGRNEAEFSMLVSDIAQGKGLGTELLTRLVQIGKDEGLERITGEFLMENHAMKRICDRLGFAREAIVDEGVVRVSLELGETAKV